ncbi:MAG: MBL fold metallo-hydrolase, partial [Actinomycetota bacterium]|nr:MBL fold metallo-hydrolase [Actinomycetota bacterium]
MRLTIIGSAGSFANPSSAASCYLVEHDGTRIVLDLGNGALGPLAAVADLRA